MLRILQSIPLLLSLLTLVQAACPVPSSALRLPRDGERVLSDDELASKLVCTNPGGLAAVRNPYLLVPGTGNTGEQSWATGYVKLLTAEGYDVCYVSPPPFMLADIQDNAEYVAYAVGAIFEQTCRPFPIQGWSQGNLAIQWMLTFFPSTRRKLTQFISLAGDFRGTVEGILVQAAQLVGSAPSVIQQTSGSNFIQALMMKGGNYNWIPTTSIFSFTDEVVQPQLDNSMSGSTSFMGGSRSGNIFVQDVCPLLSILHGQQLYFNFTFQVVLQALASPTRFASLRGVQNAGISCLAVPAPGLTDADVANLVASFAFAAEVVFIPPNPVLVEPPLRAYIARFPDNPIHD